jgi:hypothetical protein
MRPPIGIYTISGGRALIGALAGMRGRLAEGRNEIKCARCQLPALAAKDIPAGLADPGYVRATGVRAFGR